VVVVELFVQLFSLGINFGYLGIELSFDILRSSFFGDFVNLSLLLVLDHIEFSPDFVGFSYLNVQFMLYGLELFIEYALLVLKFALF
jgi:hypothetical protein